MDDVKDLSSIPIVILCGGYGIHVESENRRVLKGLIKIHEWPMIFHVLNIYVKHGFNKFVLAAGFQIEELENRIKNNPFKNAEIRVVDTGEGATTGDRINGVRHAMGQCEMFGLTYSDTISDVPIVRVKDFHIESGKAATLVAAKLPTRFRIVGIRTGENMVRGFAHKPVIENDWINGGFYFLSKSIFSDRYLGRKQNNIIFEEDILEELVRHHDLCAYKHHGMWHHLDNERDIRQLEKLTEKSGESRDHARS